MSSSQLIELRNRFVNLSNNLSTVQKYISNAHSHLSNYNDKIINYYLYDDNNADENVGSVNQDVLEDYLSTLTNSVFPAITEKINDLNSDIEEALAYEAELARLAAEKAAAEARAAEAAAAESSVTESTTVVTKPGINKPRDYVDYDIK